MYNRIESELEKLQESANLRRLPQLEHTGKSVRIGDREMLNLSSNDYLGIACRNSWNEEFLSSIDCGQQLFTTSSSRLLTGNFGIYHELEEELAHLYGNCALLFNSGYHANIGILPAVAHSDTLILADKLVHASIIDGIRLSSAKHIRYRHNDMQQLEKLLQQHHSEYAQVIIVTESIFSMDGDEADLKALVALKKAYGNTALYVDEAHAFGVRGEKGLGCAEEQGVIDEIDFLVGTFGKAAASFGAFVICRPEIRTYLINKMRSIIFTTALPPINMAWTLFVIRRMVGMKKEREHLASLSERIRNLLKEKGRQMVSSSHIIPIVVGESSDAVIKAEQLQRHGFYALPIRPPTVPEGTSRIRLSLTAALTDSDIEQLMQHL